MSAAEPETPLWPPCGLQPGRHGAAGGEAVRIGRRGCDLVQVLARRGRDADLARFINESMGLSLPPMGHAAGVAGIAALAIQPQGWLFQASPGGLAARLVGICGATAAVVDQSHGRCVFTLAGAQSRAVLARLCRIDLHPRAFGPGQVAATLLAGLSGVLHQVDDGPGYELIVASSYARAFAELLCEAAGQFGYEVV